MNTKHTPGPWHIGMKPGPIVYGPKGEQIADLQHEMVGPEEHFANARLIAAAPDLLAALEELLPMWARGIDEPWVKRARAAITKAKGE